jgi:quercetin dioxygenase-like cupin family protein
MAAPDSRPSDRISAPAISLDLGEQLRLLRSSETYRQHDHASATLVNRPGFGLVLVALSEGGHLKPHGAHRSISLHVLDGHVRVEAEGQALDLTAGHVVSLAPDIQHRVGAVEESAFLLTMGGEQLPS